MPKRWTTDPRTRMMLPVDFPIAEHGAVADRIAPHRPNHSGSYHQFLLGWRGVAYRYRAFVEAIEGLEQKAVQLALPATPEAQDDRYEQDNAVYAMFVAGVSCIECFFYAAYFAAAILEQSLRQASASGHRGIVTVKVETVFKRHWPSATITSAMSTFLSDPSWKEWYGARNVLAHRVTPARTVRPGGPDEIEIVYDTGRIIRLDIAPSALSTERNWFADSIRILVKAFDAFAAHHF